MTREKLQDNPEHPEDIAASVKALRKQVTRRLLRGPVIEGANDARNLFLDHFGHVFTKITLSETPEAPRQLAIRTVRALPHSGAWLSNLYVSPSLQDPVYRFTETVHPDVALSRDSSEDIKKLVGIHREEALLKAAANQANGFSLVQQEITELSAMIDEAVIAPPEDY